VWPRFGLFARSLLPVVFLFYSEKIGLKSNHKRFQKALACALYDERFKGRFITIDTVLLICSAIVPEGRSEDEDIEFSYITGDAGSGASVQSLHPVLRDSGTLTETSDYINCILHAFNIAYETASKDSLGDHGMNKNTVFQMCYLAVLMLMNIKKQTSLDNLVKIYKITTTQLFQNNEYLEVAGDSFIQALEEMVDFVVADSDLSTFDAQRDLRIDGTKLFTMEYCQSLCQSSIETLAASCVYCAEFD
jgi:hypothetical protein